MSISYTNRMVEIRAQIRPLVLEVLKPGCSFQRKEEIIRQLLPLYEALCALQEELDLN